jgi:hypothetical protein
MARIQDIYELEYAISEVVKEYIDCADYYKHPTLKITMTQGDIIPDIVDSEEKIDTPNEETYPMENLTLYENGKLVPDYDKINDIANKWLFLED